MQRDNEFSARLAAEIARSPLTRTQIAARLEISTGCLDNYAKGRSFPRKPMLARIRRVLPALAVEETACQ